MTQPDQHFPGDAANAEPFSAFAGRSQSEWEDRQRGKVSSHFSGFTFGINLILGAITGLQTLISNLLNAPSIVLGTINKVVVDGFGGTVENFLDGIVNGFLGLFDVGWGAGDAEEAVVSQASTTASLASAIATIQQQLGGGTTGEVNYGNEADSSSLPAVFSVTYGGPGSGTWGVLDGQTDWYSEAGNRTVFARYNVTVTDGDNQLVGMVCSSVPEKRNTAAGAVRGVNYLFGRVNATGTDYVQAKFTKDTVELSCFVAGVQTVFTSGSHTFKANNAYYLKCGTTSNARTFEILDSSSPILSYTDASAVSSMGASYRETGKGAERLNVFNAIAYPAKVAYWSMQSAA